jgi:uncharacterized protein (DUF983 family)
MLLICMPPLRPLKRWLICSPYFYKAQEGKLAGLDELEAWD